MTDNVLWGFFWTDCVYESAMTLQTLHRSKREAVRSMIRFQSSFWEKDRDNARSSMCRVPRRQMSSYWDSRRTERFEVRAVEVLP